VHESKYEDQADDNIVICPYCMAEYQPESEDFDEDTRAEECEDCGKKFYLHQSFSVTHHTRPDCELNGDTHQFERVKLTDGREADFCTVCDRCRSIKEPS
jgi:hypothetical protein